MTLTEVAAWWGAGVATLVFLWDVYKWRHSSASVKVNVAGNMEYYGPHPLDNAETHITIEVLNVGGKKTTITHLIGVFYRNWWQRLRGKSSKTFYVQQPLTAQPIPFELDVGARWLGTTRQTGDLEKLSREGHLMLGIFHSMSKRAELQRLVIAEDAKV